MNLFITVNILSFITSIVLEVCVAHLLPWKNSRSDFYFIFLFFYPHDDDNSSSSYTDYSFVPSRMRVWAYVRHVTEKEHNVMNMMLKTATRPCMCWCVAASVFLDRRLRVQFVWLKLRSLGGGGVGVWRVMGVYTDVCVFAQRKMVRSSYFTNASLPSKQPKAVIFPHEYSLKPSSAQPS